MVSKYLITLFFAIAAIAAPIESVENSVETTEDGPVARPGPRGGGGGFRGGRVRLRAAKS